MPGRAKVKETPPPDTTWVVYMYYHDIDSKLTDTINIYTFPVKDAEHARGAMSQALTNGIFIVDKALDPPGYKLIPAHRIIQIQARQRSAVASNG